MALSSPGVEVKVIDESFYTSAEPGTVPLIVVATAENKQNSGSTGVAKGTLAAESGNVFLLTSQKDLGDTFGDPLFKTDSNNNPIHAGEQNEYGLQAAYSLLGVSNRAFVLRADIDLSELDATAIEPTAAPANGTYWFDTKNTDFGIFEWNAAPATATGGQTFTNKKPIVVSEISKVVGGVPKTSVGAIGDYAIVTTTTANELFYKNRTGNWVKVGTNEWTTSLPTVAGSNPGTIVENSTLLINANTVTVAGVTIAAVATGINTAAITGVTAAVINNKVEIYTDGTVATVLVAAGTGVLATFGLVAGTYYAPALTISKHTQVPVYKLRDATPRPTGSIWIKTTAVNSGAKWRTKRWNTSTQLWETIVAPLYPTTHAAIYNLDLAGGGSNLAVGTLFVKTNVTENGGTDISPAVADFTLYRRKSFGFTTITSSVITALSFIAGAKSLTIQESLVGSVDLDVAKTVAFTATANVNDADVVAGAINAAGFTNIVAEVNSLNQVTISHIKGGEFRLLDGTGTPITGMGFATTGASITDNLYDAPDGDTANDYVASLWAPLSYTAGDAAPNAIASDGTLWYSSVLDETDIMAHDGTKWVGYQSATSPYFGTGADATDPAGPMVAAVAPLTQSDGSALADGDLWIDSSDIENFPTLYKFNKATIKWVLVDKADQSTEEGVVFSDARWSTAGSDITPASITSLLTSDYVDFDAPDPALYPKGMLLWNLRRSGFNVKKFVRNYVATTQDNVRMDNESMDTYYPHRWVTESANQDDGSGTFGRKAQRKVVVQSLQAAVNSNQQIRDEEGRVFNLIACPGYPELIGEMIGLNYDRGLTAFVVGDTPARLTSDATSLLAWGTNQKLALEDNDNGLVSSDEYFGTFYPWGFTSDNFGNNVVVPPSHMMLRTIALSDQVSYPWFAPAGVRRGGITNATAVGYVDSEGEFKSVALNAGQRDTLASIKVNPLTFITGTGLVNYGQFTRARGVSALDRINVARLVIYLRRQLNSLAKPYIFEPNDKITRDEIKASVESLLLELVGQRALYDYLVVCDTSNNTPARIDRSELYIDIAIEPVKAVEFIYIPLRLKNTGEINGLGA